MALTGRWQSILGGGLYGPAALWATQGWPLGGVRVLRKIRTGASTWRVQIASTRAGLQRFIPYVDGLRRPATLGPELFITAPSGRAPQLDFRDVPAAWPPEQYPESITLQWERIAGATRYRVQNGSGVTLATVIADNRMYYLWQSGPIPDGNAAEYRVVGVDDAQNASPAVARTFSHVTTPRDETEASISYNGDLSVDIS